MFKTIIAAKYNIVIVDSVNMWEPLAEVTMAMNTALKPRGFYIFSMSLIKVLINNQEQTLRQGLS